MVRCKAHELLRSESYNQYVAATKDSCNAADGRFPTASGERGERFCRKQNRHTHERPKG